MVVTRGSTVWTLGCRRARWVVSELIERKFDIQHGLTAVGELLARVGLTPQKSLQQAYQRDPVAIERAMAEADISRPCLARQARGRRHSVLG